MQGRMTLQKRPELGKGLWQVSCHPRLPGDRTHALVHRHGASVGELFPFNARELMVQHLTLLVEICSE